MRFRQVVSSFGPLRRLYQKNGRSSFPTSANGESFTYQMVPQDSLQSKLSIPSLSRPETWHRRPETDLGRLLKRSVSKTWSTEQHQPLGAVCHPRHLRHHASSLGSYLIVSRAGSFHLLVPGGHGCLKSFEDVSEHRWSLFRASFLPVGPKTIDGKAINFMLDLTPTVPSAASPSSPSPLLLL